MNLLSQTAILLALASLSLGFSTLSKESGNRLYRSYFFSCLVISVWSLSFFAQSLMGTGIYTRIHYLAHVWLGPISLTFVSFLTDRKKESSLSKLWRKASYFMAIPFSLITLFYLDHEILKRFVDFAPTFLSIRLIFVSFSRSAELTTVPMSKRFPLILGGLLGLGLATFDHIPQMGTVLPSLGNIFLSGYLFFISQAIARQTFFHFNAILSRFFVVIFVSLLLTGMYALVFAWIQDQPALYFLNSFIVAFFILMLSDPIRRLVAYLTDEVFTKKQERIEKALKDVEDRLSITTQVKDFVSLILLSFEKIFDPHRIQFFSLTPDSLRFYKVSQLSRAEGQEEFPLVHEFSSSSTLVRNCLELKKRGESYVLLKSQIESQIERILLVDEKRRLGGVLEDMALLSSTLLIPLIDQDEVFGMICIYKETPLEDWSNQWVYLKQIEAFCERAAKQLKSLERFSRSREKERLAELGEMASGLAHEIRNPLGAIRGATQLLKDENQESPLLSVIIEEVDRLNRVVSQFLDFSKVDHGLFTTIEINSFLLKNSSLFKALFSASVDFKIKTESRSLLISANEDHLKQVFLNLLTNAARATVQSEKNSKTPLIRIEVKFKENEVWITVEDNGHGIPEQTLSRIFLPFFTTFSEGTGLGLSISQRIVEAHQGRLEVVSQLHHGSRFSVVLPVIRDKVGSL